MGASEYKKIGFVGFGRSNRGVFEYLKRTGELHFTLRTPEACGDISGIHRYRCGKDYLSDIDEDILFISPAVRRSLPELLRARERGVILSSDAELFFALTKADVYAVTGSSGKSTVTALISGMLAERGIYAPAAGNFGKSLSSLIGRCEAVAAELSSFQLMYTEPRTKRALITNITPNHLDWHADMDEYVRAKLNIVKRSSAVITDFDSGLCEEKLGKIPFVLVSSDYRYSELCRLSRAENYLTLRENTVHLNGKPYVSVEDAPRRERHNLKNFMLAIGATLGVCSPEDCRAAIMKFGGLSHRAERVGECGGICFINSSIDTSPERTLETLRALRADTVVIISGKNKGLPLSSLAEQLPALTVGAVLMGDIGRELAPLLDKDYRYVFAEELDSAIPRACDILGSAGNVILSPAGTSFDKFKSYEERGDAYRLAVKKYIKTVKED